MKIKVEKIIEIPDNNSCDSCPELDSVGICMFWDEACIYNGYKFYKHDKCLKIWEKNKKCG